MLRLFTISFLLLFFANIAHARCHGAVTLGTLHDAYRATLEERGKRQQSGALTLLFLVGGQDAAELAERVGWSGAEISQERLAEVLIAGKDLAGATLEGRPKADTEEVHNANVRYLESVFLASRCQNSASNSSHLRGDFSPPPSLTKPKNTFASSLQQAAPTTQLLLVMAVLIGAAGGGYGAYSVWTSAYMRRKRVERLPRKPISLKFELTFTDAEGHMKQADVEAIDVSAGGMKINWSDPPPAGTTITLALPVGHKLGQIAWSNSHYAGAMFQDRLSNKDLESLRTENAAPA